jgi:hypothetical protein
MMWTRALDEEIAMKLFNSVIAGNRDLLDAPPNFKQLWLDSLSQLSNAFEAKVQFLAKAYLESPAGKIFQAHVEKSRSAAHSALPDLTIDKLKTYGGADGIKWSIQTIFDFYSILDNVADTTLFQKVLVLHCGTNSKNEFAGSQFYDPTDTRPVEWFTEDCEAALSASSDSWLHRLAAAAFYTVRQWIFVLCGYSQPGGHKVEPVSDACRQILKQVPTNPVVVDRINTYPPFPIDRKSILEWKHELPSDDESDDDAQEGTVPAVLQLFEKDIVTVQEKSNVHSKALRTIVDNNRKAANELAEVASFLTSHGGPADPNAFDIPTSPMHVPAVELQPSVYGLVYGNIKTKIDVVLALAKQSKLEWFRILGKAQEKLEEWEKLIAKLERDREDLLKAREAGKRLMATLGESGNRLVKLEESVKAQEIGELDFVNDSPSPVDKGNPHLLSALAQDIQYHTPSPAIVPGYQQRSLSQGVYPTATILERYITIILLTKISRIESSQEVREESVSSRHAISHSRKASSPNVDEMLAEFTMTGRQKLPSLEPTKARSELLSSLFNESAGKDEDN